MRRNEKRWKEETRKRGKGEKVDGEDLQAKKLKKNISWKEASA